MHIWKTLCLLFLTGCLFQPSSALAEQWADFTYAVSSDNTSITITGYTGSGGEVVLPSVIRDKPVVRIGGSVFAGQSGLTGITIPHSVTSIEDEAFSHCPMLTGAYFNGDAPLMGSAVFNGSAPAFTVYYTDGSIGFTGPAWLGYPSEMLIPASPDTHRQEAANPIPDNLPDVSDSESDQSAFARRIIQMYLLQQCRQER
jgi:hypothetical protein